MVSITLSSMSSSVFDGLLRAFFAIVSYSSHNLDISERSEITSMLPTKRFCQSVSDLLVIEILMTLQHMIYQFLQKTLCSLYKGTDQIMGVQFKHAQTHHLKHKNKN